MAERWLAMHASNASRYPRASHDLAASVEPEENRTPPSVRRNAGLRASTLEIPSEMSPGRSERAFRTGNERLYEAYNDLHSLAQDFEKPFDAPAILVVGHQTDGKSGAPRRAGLAGGAGDRGRRGRGPPLTPPAWPPPPAALVEALMGFQFNHVGGGTKTRRPITLHMKYNPSCVLPCCYLVTEEFGEQDVTLEELQVRGAAAWRRAALRGWARRCRALGAPRVLRCSPLCNLLLSAGVY